MGEQESAYKVGIYEGLYCVCLATVALFLESLLCMISKLDLKGRIEVVIIAP